MQRFINKLLKKTPIRKKPPYEHITQIGDPILRQPCKPLEVREITSSKTQKIILEMKNVMRKNKLFGMSAPQVGIPLRLFVVSFPRPEEDFPQDEIAQLEMQAFPHMVWINPVMKILDHKNQVTAYEGCGSVKGLQAKVCRYHKVHLTGYDEFAKETSWTPEGWSARIVQHEMDHLDGNLFTDKMLAKSLEFMNWDEINRFNGLVELRFR